MPIYQFKCECGNEFEKIISRPAATYKWCKHCNCLTTWEEITDKSSPYYREKICAECLGSKHVPPVRPSKGTQTEKDATAVCPTCGKDAVHILRVEVRGNSNAGVKGCASHSVGFRFNYNAPDVR